MSESQKCHCGKPAFSLWIERFGNVRGLLPQHPEAGLCLSCGVAQWKLRFLRKHPGMVAYMAIAHIPQELIPPYLRKEQT